MGNEEIEAWAVEAQAVKTAKEPIPYETEGACAQVFEVAEAMEKCAEYEGVAFDLRSGQIVVKDGFPVPWNEESGRLWSEVDDINMLSELQRGARVRLCRETKGGASVPRIPKCVVVDAVKMLADKRRFDPLRELLDALPAWDGVRRAERWAVDLLGAEDTEYTRAMCRLFCAGAVMRAYRPGEKFDYMLVLKGPQGLGKSTALRKLALRDDFFVDNIGDMKTRESVENLLGAWIVEDGELKSTQRADADTAKAFISRTADRARLAYAKYATSMPRRFVLVGTTNREQFLNDVTGNRRFAPIDCGKTAPSVDVFGPEIEGYALQLWAEAAQAYREGRARTYLSDRERKLAEEAQEASTAENEQTECILDYLAAHPDVGATVCVKELKDAVLESVPGVRSVSDGFVKLVVDNKARDCWEWKGNKKRHFPGVGARRYYERTRRDGKDGKGRQDR